MRDAFQASWLRASVLVLLFVCLASVASARDDRPGERLPACALDRPDDFAATPEPETAGEDEDDEADEDGESSATPGIRTGPSRCVFINGGVVVGNQATWFGGAAGQAMGRLAVVPFGGQLKLTFGLTHVDNSWEGGLVTDLSFSSGKTDAALETAAIYSKYFGVGLMASRFDSWTADDFAFKAIASSQSPLLAAIVPWRSDKAIVALSIEDPEFRRITLTGYGGQHLPDFVARWSATLGPVQLTATGALHQTPLDTGEKLGGWAVLASARLNLPALGDGSYLVAQATYADKALGYLGINTATNALGFRLPGALNASVAEAGLGVAGALAGVWQFEPKWRVGSFVTAMKLRIPGPAGGDILSWRGVLNTTWTPIDGVELALEGGIAMSVSNVPLVPSAHAKSVILTLTRNLP